MIEGPCLKKSLGGAWDDIFKSRERVMALPAAASRLGADDAAGGNYWWLKSVCSQKILDMRRAAMDARSSIPSGENDL